MSRKDEIQAITVRWAIGLKAAQVSLITGFVVWGIVESVRIVAGAVEAVMTADNTPPWLTALSVILAAVTGSASMGLPTLWWILKFRDYMAKHSERTRVLESERDATRTSSDLNKDGTHDIDG